MIIEVNAATLDLITHFEGFVNHWYPDPAHGWKVPTCAYGHTDAAGEPKFAETKDKTFTPGEGREILARDLGKVSDEVFGAVTVPLNPNQFGALVSFTYNLGIGNLKSSHLLKKVNAGDFVGARLEFKKWVKADGKVLPGLVKRRQAEADLFATPTNSQEPPMANPATAVVVDTQNPLASTKNWALLVGLISLLAPLVGIHLPADFGDTAPKAIGAAMILYSMIRQIFFTKTISTIAAKKL